MRGMEHKSHTFKRIEKENLDKLNFPVQEILHERADIDQRKQALHRATGLGNLLKHKVLIRFADEEGPKEVYTTIWAITDNKVLLKAGRLIPVHRIYSVEIAYSS